MLIQYGFTPYTASRLLNNTLAGLSNKQLKKLWMALRCTLHDIYVWKKPVDGNISQEHLLHAVVPQLQSLNRVQQLWELPLEQLEAIQKFMEERWWSVGVLRL